ncbi:MAG: hypothetical protein IJY52_01520 [Anaerotignum sp.]|nr:hypothetical protein [Anaerotignum sp.]
MMPDLIANSVFKENGVEYRPGDVISAELPNIEKLMEKGFVVYRGSAAAAKKAIAEAKAAEEGRAAEEKAKKEAEEKARQEAEEKAAAETAEKKSEEKPVKGRKGKVEE